ncbi:MAG: transglycosylase domain-containing protein [Deltaproteobacteria bacterium]|nr:transglycosylase domain-containing protein [Deltaproteobacteria bacterium]
MAALVSAFMAALAIVTLAVSSAAYHMVVRKYPGAHIERSYIMSVLARESPIYASDGVTRIGAFSGLEHRDYVPLDQIPAALRQAIVASEDRKFYRHFGVDPLAIASAIYANLRAGRMVRGGSTITQQTAKNLFKRKDRSFQEKWRELVNALRLEAHYTKDEILEFYLNQFHVNANGRGVGVAARHFFDKEVAELTLVESAFIAGSVKGPFYYDPFSTSDPDRQARNIARANVRKDYVIRRMFEEKYIDRPAYEAALATPVPFRQGHFRFERNVIADMVQRELASDDLAPLLQGRGGESLYASGYQIFTSIDPEAQKDALYALRSQLSRLKILLEGTAPAPATPSPPSRTERGDFLAGVVAETGADGVRVRLGPHLALMDPDGAAACAEPAKGHKTANPWARVTATEIRAFMQSLQPGQTVPVIVRREPFTDDSGGHPALLDCAYPYTREEKLQGALIVLDDGFIRAVAAGFSNADFNRAVDARRQAGSAFKPVVYYAALQLGWSPADMVRNRREVYRWGNVSYRPRNDHPPVSDEMSLAWVGTQSENYASVWLLAHLTDRLTDPQFAAVAGAAGLGPAEGETSRQTIARLRDRHGIMIRQADVREAAFQQIRAGLVRDMQFAGEAACAAQLDRLGFDATTREEILEALKAERDEKTEARRPERKADAEIAVERYENLQRNLNDPSAFTGLPVPLAGCSGDVRRRLVDETEKLAREQGIPVSFDPAVWRRFRDYRMAVNVHYVITMARSLGIQSPLAPVLSLPLGTSDVTLAEMAHFYEEAGQGTTRGPAPRLVREIRSAEGELLWSYEGEPSSTGSPQVSASWLEILRNTPVFGTARGAADLVTLTRNPDQPGADVRVPFFGKTGTTNRYQNVYFVGLFPRPDPDAGGKLSHRQLFTVAAYMGYDDNRPMTHGRVRVYGSTGALPMVLESARGMIDRADYPFDAGDLAVRMAKLLPMGYPDGFLTVSINATTGLPDDAQMIQDRTELELSSHPYLVLPGRIVGNRFEPARFFEPVAVEPVQPEIPQADREALLRLLEAVTPTPAGDGTQTPAREPSPAPATPAPPEEETEPGSIEDILEEHLGPPSPPPSSPPPPGSIPI